MKIFNVESTLVATARIRGLELHRLLVVVDRKGSKQVAVDPVGCKPGDWVIACGSSAAREAAGHKDYPSDLTIVGIIDYWDEDAPGQKPAEAERAEEPELLIVEAAAAPPDWDEGSSGEERAEESELLIVERVPAAADGEARR